VSRSVAVRHRPPRSGEEQFAHCPRDGKADRALLVSRRTGPDRSRPSFSHLLAAVCRRGKPRPRPDGQNRPSTTISARSASASPPCSPGPQATFASADSRFAAPRANLSPRHTRSGLPAGETLEVTLPAVITTDLRLNEPRLCGPCPPSSKAPQQTAPEARNRRNSATPPSPVCSYNRLEAPAAAQSRARNK